MINDLGNNANRAPMPESDDVESLMAAALAHTPERTTAQQAADAAMEEIQEYPYTACEPPLVVVRVDWLRAFLTNLFAEWLTEIGGEQADLTQPAAVCEWVEDSSWWSSGCDITWGGDSPGDCQFKFCPYCGKPIHNNPYFKD